MSTSCGLNLTITTPKLKVSTGNVEIHSNYSVEELRITENGVYTAEEGTAYSQVEVNVPVKNFQIDNDVGRVSSATYVRMPNIELVVNKSGTYNVYWSGYRSSTSGVFGTQLCINGIDYGTPITSFDETFDAVQNVCLENVQLEKDDVLTIKGRARTVSYSMYAIGLTIVEV